MRTSILVACIFLTLVVSGCEIPQIIRPLRLYDLEDGRTIEVFLQRGSRNSGRLVSARIKGERFEGEIVLYGGAGEFNPRPSFGGFGSGTPGSTGNTAEDRGQQEKPDGTETLPELYGFGGNSSARPAGTAVLIGTEGTMIEIVLYKLSGDMQYGDGVARDNRGRRYRVFLSTES